MNTQKMMALCKAEAAKRVQSVKAQYPNCESVVMLATDWVCTSLMASGHRTSGDASVSLDISTNWLRRSADSHIMAVGDIVPAGASVRPIIDVVATFPTAIGYERVTTFAYLVAEFERTVNGVVQYWSCPMNYTGHVPANAAPTTYSFGLVSDGNHATPA